jgi:hypothetical protein
MGTEAWNAMEALATRMTDARIREEKKRLEKLEKIRRFNEKHQIAPVAQVETTVTVYELEPVEKPIINHWYQVAKQLLPKKK